MRQNGETCAGLRDEPCNWRGAGHCGLSLEAINANLRNEPSSGRSLNGVNETDQIDPAGQGQGIAPTQIRNCIAAKKP